MLVASTLLSLGDDGEKETGGKGAHLLLVNTWLLALVRLRTNPVFRHSPPFIECLSSSP